MVVRRREAEIAFDRADVGKGLLDVADLHRLGIEQRLLAGCLLEQLDDAHQIFAAAVADIVDRVRTGAPSGLGRAIVGGREVEAGEHAADDIVDIGEIAPHLAAVEQGQGLAGKKRVGEDPHRHVGPAPRPIDREEAQARQRDSKQVGICLAQQLVGFLRRGIKRQRMVDPVLDPERQALVAAVDRRRRGIDHVARLPRAGDLEHIGVTDEVRLDVSLRILEAEADAGLRTEMDDAAKIDSSVTRLSAAASAKSTRSKRKRLPNCLRGCRAAPA